MSTIIPKPVEILQVNSAPLFFTRSNFAAMETPVPTKLAVSKLCINVLSGNFPIRIARNTIFAIQRVVVMTWFGERGNNDIYHRRRK